MINYVAYHFNAMKALYRLAAVSMLVMVISTVALVVIALR